MTGILFRWKREFNATNSKVTIKEKLFKKAVKAVSSILYYISEIYI